MGSTPHCSRSPRRHCRFAITGASGAIGVHLVPEFLRPGAGRLRALTHRTLPPAHVAPAGVEVRERIAVPDSARTLFMMRRVEGAST
jgi:hypothetical protein